MVNKIQTFGYEGLAIERFVARLTEAGTQVVIDVRANPLSRKPGFSKKSFQAHLEAAGIGYVHAVEVGCPKPVRDRYKQDGNWATYTKGYTAFLKTRDDEVAAIAKAASKAVICLVCFEADYALCHRSFVADAAAAKAGLKVEHLTGQTTFVSQPRTAA